MTAAAWTIEGLTARLGGRLAVDNVSLTARSGEVVGVLGANGSGKTTLLRAGLGLIKADAGTVRLGGEPLEGLSEAGRARLAGYLPQERRVGWNLAALEIAALGAPDLPPARAREVAAGSLARVGLSGLPMARLRAAAVAGAALLTGAAVAAAGVIGFVGLVAPHLVRRGVGDDPARTLAPSALAGAVLLVLADLAARVMPTEQELKLGVVTALFGAPVFAVVAWRAARSWRA